MGTSQKQEECKYITPYLKEYTSLSELIDKKNTGLYGSRYTWEEILLKKTVAILGEPGFGKSRLLRELVKNTPNAICVDLKSVQDKKIINILKTKYCIEENEFEIENISESTICFDALDEVKGDNFLGIVDQINEFIQDNKETKIILSCRINHFEKWNPNIPLDCFLSIAPLDSQGIFEFLKNGNLSDDEFDKVWKKYRSPHLVSVIQTPRYLEILLNLFKHDGVDKVLNLTKISLFDELINSHLSIESNKLTSNNINENIYIKRVQQTLALIMEVNQTNLITEEEFWTIVDDVKSEIFTSHSIHYIPDFWERTLIKKNANNEIEFQNTEIQEYLAASEINRLGNLEQSIFDFAFDPLLKEVLPSWYNTLSFLIDLNPTLFKSLLNFTTGNNHKIIHTEDVFKLIRPNSNSFTEEEKAGIFNFIFTYFQNNGIWIPFEVEESLPTFYTAKNKELLINSIDARRSKGVILEVKRGNTASIVKGLVKQNSIVSSESSYWKRNFTNWLKENKTLADSAYSRFILEALISFNDIDSLKEIQDTYELGGGLYKEKFIRGCAKINPDDDFSIQHFIKAFLSPSMSMLDYYAREAISKLNKKESILNFLSSCLENRRLLIKFNSQFEDQWRKEIDHNLIHFLDNVDKFWDQEISTLLNNIILNVYLNDRIWELKSGKFIFSLLDLLKSHDKNYLFHLMTNISTSNNKNSNYYDITTCFAHLIEEEQTEKFIEKFSTLFPSVQILSVFLTIENRYPEKISVVEIAKRVLHKEYEENKQHWLEYDKRHPQKESSDESVYAEFLYKLEPEKDRYMSDLFDYYIINHEKLINKLTSEDKERLKDLIINILQRSPKSAKLEITEKTNNGSTYTVTNWIHEFIACVNLLSKYNNELNINITEFRKNIIQILPFSYNDTVRNVLTLLGNQITNDEINSLMEVYDSSASDDIKTHLPNALIATAKKYHIKEAIPVLQYFVDLDASNIDRYYRIESLNLLGILLDNEEYFLKIFEKFSKSNDDDLKVAEEANTQLIIRYRNESAIKWRFKQLNERAFEFTRPRSEGARIVSGEESELTSKTFGRALLEISDPDLKLYDDFEKLLNFALRVSENNEKMELYSQYLLELFCMYLNNLKTNKNYIPIDRFEKWILKNESKKGVNWLKYKLFEAKRIYMNYLSKPKNIRDSVRKYNIQKDKHFSSIYSTIDLINVAEDIIETDINRWARSEGGYRIFYDFDLIKNDNSKGKTRKPAKAHEEFVQKTIKSQFELGFLRREFREADLNVIREPQLLNDKKPDFLVSYGLSGRIIIEIKLSDNNEVKLKKKGDYYQSCHRYKKKITNYPKGFGTTQGIFLIVNLVKKRSEFKTQINKLKDLYNDTDIKVVGLDCSI
ncbi:NACHT domain-containing protein [Marinifilum caeruleilacunae]|uniref:ATP-binding protein n=1 Tax=Marinifilum caeruleilacunae TaxID=2499076 RepID=A0ABX1WXH7_9BACT|nr:hypothetical protein [Marinifilum caeruleilacunae]NOU60824.1 hypothetical protein [Marinifilum caeruleilacunae]